MRVEWNKSESERVCDEERIETRNKTREDKCGSQSARATRTTSRNRRTRRIDPSPRSSIIPRHCAHRKDQQQRQAACFCSAYWPLWARFSALCS